MNQAATDGGASSTRTKLLTILSFILPSLALCLILATIDQIFAGAPDSDNYQAFARSILSGEILEKRPIEEIPLYRAIRTPVYPTLILLVTGGFQGEIHNMLWLHMVFAVASVVAVSVALRPYCPPLVAGGITAGILLLMYQHYKALMTEWSAVNIVLLAFALIVATIRNPSIRNLFLLSLLAVLGVVLRPALAPLLIIPPIMILYSRRFIIREWLLYASALLPLLAWMTFNWYHIEAFTLAQLKGHNSIGIGAIVGHAEVQPGDPPELQKFIVEYNEVKQPAYGEEDEFVATLDDHYVKAYFEQAIYWIAYPLRDEELGIIRFDREFMGVYGERAIAANPDNYVKYVIYNLKSFFSFKAPYLTLILVLVPIYAAYKKQSQPLAYATLILFAVHCLAGVLFSTFQAVTDRYVEVTFYPYVMAVAICLISLVLARFTRLNKWLRLNVEP